MIDFTRAFDSAWERMMVILFRPFDFGKWCVIGFSAFLAGLIAGGNGVSGSFNTNNFNPSSFKPGNIQVTTSGTPGANPFDLHQLNAQFNHLISGVAIGLVVAVCLVIFILLVAFWLLMFWLGSRGQFLFLDNIVRNRGAIGVPWQFYARQANSLLGFYLILALLSFVLILPILVVAGIMCIPLVQQHRWPGSGEITGFVVLGILYAVVAIAYSVVLFLFREFTPAIMFRQGLLARPAFFATIQLVRENPGSICVFLLLRIAIFIAMMILCVILCFATCCCFYNIPYVGTLFLLPVLVFVRCFTLDCLAQLGCDVFTVDVTTEAAPPVTPPLPPG